jgi:hypothetical protein
VSQRLFHREKVLSEAEQEGVDFFRFPGVSSLASICGQKSDPETVEHRILYDNNGKGVIAGVSVAIDTGDVFYEGSFQGDRVVKLSR